MTTCSPQIKSGWTSVVDEGNKHPVMKLKYSDHRDVLVPVFG